jgi:hypothetical protein
MPTFMTYEGTPSKMFNFNGTGIKTLVTVLEQYSKGNNSIQYEEAAQVVDTVADGLHTKLVASSKFTFTQDEIREAVRRFRP